jgi:sulfoquinovose isomerase
MPDPSSSSWRGLSSHRHWLAAESARLLEFARGSRVDRGFGWLDAAGRPEAGRPVQLWITTRMTHVFALGDLMGHPGCAPLVDHGLATIRDTFEDRTHGGWFSEVGDDGPVRTEKEAYSHAFVLLAAAGASLCGRPGAGALLDAIVAVVDERFWSEEEGACLESWDRGWQELEAYRGANANMHMIEAFLAAGDATGDTRWDDRARRIAERLIRDVAGANDWRILEHFDGDWRPLPDYNAEQPRHPFRPFGITPGHGLEWSRLLLQIGAALEQPPDWLVEAAQGLFGRATADGWGAPGGFAYTTGLDGRPAVADRLHWPVTEAIGAAAVLHDVTGEAEYERWYRTCWDFAGAYLIDRERGSWHAELDEDLRPSEQTWSGKPDVYHSIQATIIPRLPVRPSLAGALRDGQLA